MAQVLGYNTYFSFTEFISMIIYIHGYGSSGLSDKARHYQKLFADQGFIAPTLSTDARLAMHTLDALVESFLKHGPVGLMGSSLGGFFAIYLAHKYGIPAVLINPAIPPWDLDLSLQSVSNARRFQWQAEQLKRLEPFRVVNPELAVQQRCLLLQQMGDEVLDPQLALDYLSGAQQIIEQGGNHRFSGIERHDEAVRQFFTSYLVLK